MSRGSFLKFQKKKFRAIILQHDKDVILQRMRFTRFDIENEIIKI